jgi:broad specificity phosphatase PhoE
MKCRLRAALVSIAVFALTSSLALAQTAVFVVRHAEKISESDQRLTPAGHERARRLAKLLGAAGIRAIYATDTERAKDTARPLSEALKIPIATYDIGKGMAKGEPDATAFAAELRRDHPKDTVLVVGHSNTLPAILKALGVREEIEIAAEQYDDVFVIVPGGSGAPTLVRLKD